MKITVPEYVLQYDLNENELVFMSLLLFFTKKCGRDEEFVFFADDVKRILGKTRKRQSSARKGTVELSAHGPWAQNLMKVTHFAINDFYNWGFALKGYEQHLYKNGALQTTTVRLRNKESIVTYAYLVGRLTDSNLIEDASDTKLKYDKESTKMYSGKVMNSFFYETFEI